MADFTLDTSGFVEAHPPQGIRTKRIYWSGLDAFTQGYVEALLASEIIVPGPDGPEPLLRPAFSDLAPETLARIIADCADFQKTWRITQPERGFARGFVGGRDFWWLRNNRDLTTPPFPSITPYLGDDGKVRLREGA